MDFQEIWYWRIFRKSKKNTSFVKIWQLTECKLHEDRYTSLIIYRPFFRIMRFLGRENQNAYFMFSNLFFFEICAFCGITLKNILESARPQMTIFRLRIACWIREATNTHSEYAILAAFPLQHWLYERTSVLRYTYVSCRWTVGRLCWTSGESDQAVAGLFIDTALI